MIKEVNAKFTDYSKYIFFVTFGITPIKYAENPYVEITGFNVRFCSKVRGYQIQNNIYDQNKKKQR